MREDLRLPTEIYPLIFSYTPSRILRTLYSVNNAFFHAAMDARYGSVRLASLKEKTFMRNIIRLSDPFVARRVRSLFIDAHFIVQAEQYHDFWLESKSDGNLPPLRIRNSRGHAMHSTEAIMEAIQRVLPLLTLLSGFSFVMDKDIPIKIAYGNAQSLAKACLESLKSTVRVLKVSLVYDTVPIIFPPTLKMAKVDDVSIKVGRPRSYIAPKGNLPVLQVLSTSVRNCRHTVGSISLCLPDPELRRDGFTLLLRELGAVTGLASLQLCLPFLRIFRSELIEMLMTHSRRLMSLKLRSSPVSTFVPDSAMAWLRTEFPRTNIFPELRMLEIGRSILLPPDASQLDSQWLEPFQSLTALSIKYDIDKVFCDDIYYDQCMQQLPLRENLRCLRLDILVLDEELLPSLMNSFPNLKWLYLNFESVQLDTVDQENVKSNPTVYFKAALEKRNLSNWQIQHLRISSSTYPGRIMKQYREMFKRAFPSLKTCGVH
ncbi:hypothetical protein BDQ17DRAFT_1432868 [Cyathus striatus]|nr:hypothetical protein BDQ17DRAFT_1432868 [Cyathus striatus]